MITRFYADNFRTLVNFEVRFDRLNLIMGPNGSGKSSVFEILRRLQQFIAGDCRLQSAFSSRDLTRWQDAQEQRFELDVTTAEGELRYVLVVEHLDGEAKCRVKEECLSEGSHLLFERNLGQVQLYRDDFSQGPTYPFDWTLPALATVQARPDNKKLTAFRRQMNNLVIAAISPSQMEPDSRGESETLTRNMENFVSWYRRASQENMASMFELFTQLREVLPGFASFSFKDAGQDTKALRILFDRPGSKKKQDSYGFNELSDGQRVLIAIYALIHGLKGEGLCLFLDEPDNFVSLREIQPWLTALDEVCGESFDQAVIISHHPEIINFLGTTKSRWLSRGVDGPTRIKNEIPVDHQGLSLAEIIARGWEE